MSDRYIPKGRPLPAIEIWFARQLVQRLGPTEAARCVGVSKNTFANALAGLCVYPATEAMFRAARLNGQQAA